VLQETVILLFSLSADSMSQCRRAEHGFALFELILAIALATIVATWAASAWMRQVEDALAQATGAWMLSVHNSVNQMLRRQADYMSGLTHDLSAGSHYENLLVPTIAELIHAGHLPNGFALVPPIPYLVSIRISAPQGDCATMGCRIEALIFAQPPANQQAQASDVTRIGHILTAMQGVGASVHPLAPDRIKGPGLEMENRIEGQSIAFPVGTIVSKSFYDSSRYAHLIRREDRRDNRLEGRLGVKNDIASDADIHAKGQLRSHGRLTTGEFLQLQGKAVADGVCEADGLVARSDTSDLLTCHAGRWRSAGNRFGGVYSWHSNYGCSLVPYGPPMPNPMSGGCFCPVGFNSVQISRWKDETSNMDDVRTYICLR
jgi:type II secretory pathway pseudopilin PulG